MLDALKQVSGPLYDCARLAGGVLIVEFKTAEHRERFAGTRVVGEESPAVLRCVDEALTPESGTIIRTSSSGMVKRSSRTHLNTA